ncbi:endonuclease/exonuclease/phosphatase family protein [Marinomonas sp. 2405UD68-3]|uniref:endonuclease/exonuclease/phosphatase family protein n=1 Tax=Marinomonas sp. 2405UD68-3 TaxID=3391835 RepID=UPI0039C9A48F
MVIRVATFNTALSRDHAGDLARALLSKQDQQAKDVAQIIMQVSADVILLNEFDYDETGASIDVFQDHYLSMLGTCYPYTFIAPVNTGMPSGRDLNKDGIASDNEGDALGYGFFPGQYGMAILSRFPINVQMSRTFQTFLWKDMPNAKLPSHPDGGPWFDRGDLAVLPLSSKAHWDLSVDVEGQTVHFLCSHPTPPVFDGVERRNACRNHDEIRFWTEYLSNNGEIYDDNGQFGSLAEKAPFIILGDLNASLTEGESLSGGIGGLLDHPRVLSEIVPSSEGALNHSPNLKNAQYHTASWKIRADYVLPSKDFTVLTSAVFWPVEGEPMARAVTEASDHRLVYLDVQLN